MVGRTKKRAPPKKRGSPNQDVSPPRQRESPLTRRSPRQTNSPQASNKGDFGNINVSPANDQSLESQANLDVGSDLVEPGSVADHFENDNENVTQQLAEPDFESLDPYSVLGVPERATTRQIKHAFHKLSKQYHPDRLPSLPNQQDTHTTFTSISNAYEILGDPDKRSEHDLTLLAFHTASNNAPNHDDHEDSLNQDDPEEDKLHSSTASNSKT